jgi:hypothetical protein
VIEFVSVKDGKIAEAVPCYYDTVELVETLSDDKAGAHKEVVGSRWRLARVRSIVPAADAYRRLGN